MASALDEDDEETPEHDFVGHLLPLTSADFDELDRSLEADYLRISKEWYAFSGGRVGDLDAMEDLNLEETTAPKSKKPDFYDVAFNYVAGFDMEAIARRAGLRGDEVVESESESEEEEAPVVQEPTPTKKSGWGFGLFGSK